MNPSENGSFEGVAAVRPARCVLAVTTSTPRQGVWLRVADAGGVRFDAGLVWAAGRGDRGADPSRPSSLTRAIAALLASAGAEATDLTGLACDVGPGTFTGLRLGLSTARAMAWALQVPAFGATSLALLAADAQAAAPGPVVVALPARLGVSFVAVGSATGDDLDAAVVADADAAAFLGSRLGPALHRPGAPPTLPALAGSALMPGTSLRRALDSVVPAATAAPVGPLEPDAHRLLEVAWRAPASAWGAAWRLVPVYLAASEAEVHRGHVVDQEALAAERR